MEIAGIEPRHLAKPFCVEDRQCTVAQRDQPFGAQPLQRSIDVDRREAECVSKLLLGQGQTELAILNQADALHAGVQLTQQMRDSGMSVPSSEIDDPGAQHCLINEAGPPECLPLARRFDQRGTRDGGDFDLRKGKNTMVRLLQDRSARVTDIAGKKEAGNLAPAVRQHLVAPHSHRA